MLEKIRDDARQLRREALCVLPDGLTLFSKEHANLALAALDVVASNAELALMWMARGD